MAKSILNGLSVGAIGVFYLMHKYPGIKKDEIMKSHRIGDRAMRTIYKELVNAEMIQFQQMSVENKKTMGYVVANKLDAAPTAIPEKIKVYKDSAKKRIALAVKFYEDELDANLNKPLSKPYANLITYLNGNNDLSRRLDHILLVPNQLKYEDFEDLVRRAKEKGVNLKGLLDSMMNNKKYTKDREGIYTILKNWINRD